jgi:small subunit ribosomal protein S1
VVKITDFGVFLALPNGIEGLIHTSEFGGDRTAKPEQFAIGQELQAKIIKIDSGERKISLSLKAQEQAQERADLDSYMSGRGRGEVSIGEMMQQKRRGRGEDD